MHDIQQSVPTHYSRICNRLKSDKKNNLLNRQPLVYLSQQLFILVA